VAFNFGTSAAHSNSIHFGDFAGADGTGPLTVAFWIYIHTAPAAQDTLISKRVTGGGDGWNINIISTRRVRLQTEGAVGQEVSTVGTAIPLTTWTHVIVAWDNTWVRLIQNGVYDAKDRHEEVPVGNAANFTIGNNVTPNDGVACSLGQIMIWDSSLTNADAVSSATDQLYFGGKIPDADNLQFWCRAEADPGYDLITNTAGTKVGTVTIDTEHTALSRAAGHGFEPPAFGNYQFTTFQVVNETETTVESLGEAMAVEAPAEEVTAIDGDSGKNVYDPQGYLDDTVAATSTSTEVVSATTTSTEVVTQAGKTSTTWTKGTVAPETTWTKGTVGPETTWRSVFPPFIRRTVWTND
jgi:hypothetical protein